MAKKRTTGSESRPAAAAAQARQPRKRTKAASAPTTPSPVAAAADIVEDTPIIVEDTPIKDDGLAVQAVAVAAPAPAEIDRAPSPDEIAHTAYQYWLARGGQGGSPEDDWFRAERELRSRRTLKAEA
jgi:hypothetical protein